MIFEKKPEIKDYLEIAVELLDMGRNDGYITSDGLANIPELVVQANDVCKSIFYGINGQLKHAEPITIINTTLGWSAYAGIGAVYFWNEDYQALKEKGIYDTLTEKRGIDCMSENIAWGQRKRFSDGGYSVAYSRFLGYDEGMVVNQQEAAVVRKIYRYFIAGHSTHDIAKILTRQEIPTPSNKSTWTDGVVKGILENEKYKGDALLQKGYTENYLTKKVVKNNGELPQYYVTDGHKAIINREMFDYVQTEMKNRERSGYFLSSHFYSARIFCGTCAAKYGSKFWHHSSAHQALVWSCFRCR